MKKVISTYKRQKYCYLGFLGLIGLFGMPVILGAIQGNKPW